MKVYHTFEDTDQTQMSGLYRQAGDIICRLYSFVMDEVDTTCVARLQEHHALHAVLDLFCSVLSLSAQKN